mmetsp:Transcript_31372/g.42494  ORF Transcript_31372/g.42494 Transcript_31372/m.42494 type:complete len:406 (-) Transcript_31372:291-1508(-)
MENLGKQQQQILMSAGAIQALTSAWKTIGELYELDDCLLDGSHVWNDAGLVIAASKELNRANSKQGRKEKVREWAANTPHACVIPQSSVDTVDDSSMQGALVIAAVVQKTKETCVDAPGKETASPNKSIFNDNEVVLLRALFNKNGIVLKATDTQLKVKGANSSLPLIRKACGLGLLNIYILRKTPSTMSIFFFKITDFKNPAEKKEFFVALFTAIGMNMDDYLSSCGDSDAVVPAGVNCGCALKEKDMHANLWSNPSHTYGGSMPDKQTESGHQPGDSGAHALAAEYASGLSQDTSQTSNRVSTGSEHDVDAVSTGSISLRGHEAPDDEYGHVTVRKETNRKEKYHQMRSKGNYGAYGRGSDNDSSSDSEYDSSSSDGGYHIKVRCKTSHDKKDDDDSTDTLRT